MKGLRTGRVVVIDDNQSEADVLLRALGTLGIGAVYFSGKDEAEFPAQPVVGVRVVFLDLHLMEMTGDDLQYTIGVLKGTVAPSRGETGLICWTKHSDEVIEFDKLLRERLPEFRPAFVASIAKQDYNIVDADVLDLLEIAIGGWQSEPATPAPATSQQPPQPASITREAILGLLSTARATRTTRAVARVAELSGKITELVQANHGVSLIGEWEQFVHDATTHTTALLANVATSIPAPQGQLLHVQAALAKASAGSTCASTRDALAHFIEGTSELLLDHLFPHHDQFDAAAPHAEALLNELTAESLFTDADKATLNRALLTAQTGPTPTPPQPGNIYVPHCWDVTKSGPFPMATDIPRVVAFIGEIWPDLPKWALQAAGNNTSLFALASASVPCVLEITPACDHAQRKSGDSRLLGGILIPCPPEGATCPEMPAVKRTKRSLPAQSRVFAKEMPLVNLTTPHAGLDGIYLLVVNARLLFSKPIAEVAGSVPAFRLRNDICTDVTSWFAGHAARPGYVFVA